MYWTCNTHSRDEKLVEIFVVKCEGRPSCRWENNTKMDLSEMKCEVVDWTELSRDRIQ